MNKSTTKLRLRFRKSLASNRLETGFTMLEAVVVVGVLLALAIGGFFAYGPIVENAKKAKVKSSASEVHTGVLVASMDGDPTTNPQGVIDTWNASTEKIRVEILEHAASVPAMTTAAPTAGANGDFCVQATNVESPHITAREGACSDDISGTPVIREPDTDGDGTPDATDPDIDGDGVPNTAWESYNIVKDKQAAGTEVSYVNADGSTTTWNYTDTTTYDHAHDPVSPNVIESGYADILRIARSTTDPKVVSFTVGTNGLMSTATGAVGGHFGVYMHGDITCKNDSNGTLIYGNGRNVGVLDALYLPSTGEPGFNTADVSFGCSWGHTPVALTLYPDRNVDWVKSDGSPGYSYMFTKHQTIRWVAAAG